MEGPGSRDDRIDRNTVLEYCTSHSKVKHLWVRKDVSKLVMAKRKSPRMTWGLETLIVVRDQRRSNALVWSTRQLRET